jgi:hypothetical protein
MPLCVSVGHSKKLIDQISTKSCGISASDTRSNGSIILAQIIFESFIKREKKWENGDKT